MGEREEGDKIVVTQRVGEQRGGKVTGVEIHYHGQTAEPEKPRLPYEPETVLIPAGAFLMGDDDDPLAAPQHTVELPAFHIGRYPVTNEQFAHFLRKTNRVAASELLWDGNRSPEGKDQHPVTGVTWYDALAYCQWLSEQTGRPYTLPSEAQWEKAARGADGARFPWGDGWDAERCNADPEAIVAVDARPAQIRWGDEEVYDLVGNAREWTATLWGASPRAPDDDYRYPWADDGRDDLSAPRTTRRVFRGGRGEGPATYRCSARGSYLPERPGPRRNRHGFRVARAVREGIPVDALEVTNE